MKLQNMLLDKASHLVKLADFGNAKFVRQGVPSTAYQVTRFYRAPELILGNGFYGTEVDAWAAGCVVPELRMGRVFLAGRSSNDQFRRIAELLGQPNLGQMERMLSNERGGGGGRVAAQAQQLCRQLGLSNKANQPAAPTREHRLQLGREKLRDLGAQMVDLLLSLLLVYSPKERATASSACEHAYFDELRLEQTRLPNGRRLPLERWKFALRTTRSATRTKRVEQARRGVPRPRNWTAPTRFQPYSYDGMERRPPRKPQPQ